MIVMHNGETKELTREEFYKLVFNEEQQRFLKMFDLDFGKLEQRVLALGLSGRKATHIIGDDLIVEGHPDQINPVKNKPQIKTNRRTKGNKHPLPFYLGSNRRY